MTIPDDAKDIMTKWQTPPIVAENEQLKARVLELEKKWAHAVDAYRAADERKTELEAEVVRLEAFIEWTGWKVPKT